MGSYLPDDELRSFIASLPTRRLASAAIIRDESGRVLTVEPNYKDDWTLTVGVMSCGMKTACQGAPADARRFAEQQSPRASHATGYPSVTKGHDAAGACAIGVRTFGR